MRAMLPAHLQGSINSPSSSPPKQILQVGSSSSSSALSAWGADMFDVSRGLRDALVGFVAAVRNQMTACEALTTHRTRVPSGRGWRALLASALQTASSKL